LKPDNAWMRRHLKRVIKKTELGAFSTPFPAPPATSPISLLRGYRTLLNCPVCGREVLTVTQAHYLTNTVHTGNIGLAEKYLAAHDCGLLIFEPLKLETCQLSGCRVIVAPVCKNHRIDFDRLEREVLLACRFGQILREG